VEGQNLTNLITIIQMFNLNSYRQRRTRTEIEGAGPRVTGGDRETTGGARGTKGRFRQGTTAN